VQRKTARGRPDEVGGDDCPFGVVRANAVLPSASYQRLQLIKAALTPCRDNYDDYNFAETPAETGRR
jgi:hypothetical protein